jgi:hypothetical protein
MLLENHIGVFDPDMAVPDILGVNHDHGTVAALIHASGVIDPDVGFQPGFLYQLFEPGMHVHRVALNRTRAPGRADKNMFFKRSHFSRSPGAKLYQGTPEIGFSFQEESCRLWRRTLETR